MEELKSLIEVVAKALVDNPEEVHVNPMQGEQTLVLELRVAKTDLGKIIGRKGNNARAIRTLLTASSAKLRKRTVLEIIEG